MRRRIYDSVLAMLFLALVPGRGTAIADGLTFSELQQRSREIVRMTEVERGRLQRNWRDFQALPEERKQRYRLLYAQLEADRQAGNKLNHTLQTYEAWLQTLTPGERADLRQAADPAAKLTLVRKIKSDQDSRNRSRVLNEPPDLSPMFWRGFRDKAEPLSSQELRTAMNALAELLPAVERDTLPDPQDQDDKWTRFRMIVTASANRAGGPAQWPSQEQQAALVAALNNTGQAVRLKNMSDDQQRRIRWGHVIFSSFADEFLRDYEQFRPKAEELERLFTQADNAERDAMMRMPPWSMKWKLSLQSYRIRMEDDADFGKFVKSEQEFRKFTFEFLGKGGFFIRGGPGGRAFPRPRDGRHFRDDREGPPQERMPRQDGRFRRPRRDEDLPPPGRPPEG